MIVNLLLGSLIFGYAGWTIYRRFRISKQGKCQSCSIKDNCSTNNGKSC
ncbi:FeoB-associated Cys-rich membrane protein [Thermoactinomyces sp. AMNI-1]|uniref:FeoB-associated Cys-rich membrane protein n=1 Tax=Thermoactinomyces mirandus TaxID=2756294 RepID=A0A7W1XSQ0_9BACL|nr:FeoB-associated Cys-rich membrane protein [Thermoactinomyces mirandus]MBA4602380.1 FeoB-associated Cys-rich membrane protein [Thermoactinomyces mirandus]